MHFRTRYIIRNFDFRAEISVSDPTRQIEVRIAKRPDDATHPPFEPYQGVATAICHKELPSKTYDEAASSGRLSANSEGVSKIHQDLQAIVLRTLRLSRWKANSPKSGPNLIQFGTEFSWSLDGESWKEVADNRRLKLEFFRTHSPWAEEDAKFVRTEILGELDEPFAHELLREAVVNRKDHPRSSLVIAVAAAEVGFKQFASKALPDSVWILEKLQSPSLETMLKVFPWSKLGVLVSGKVPNVPSSIRSELKKAIELRNQVVHVGIPRLEGEKVDSALTAVRDLLYFFDALQGQNWAFRHMSADSLKSLS